MASNLPIDFSHPSVREYVALIRLQVLTPLSTLVHIATILAVQFIISPTLGEIIAQLHRTSITPQPSLIGVFLLVLWGLQIGYCFLIVVAWSEDTKKAIVHGTGMTFVLSNWLMAAFAVALSTRSMVAATIIVSILTLFLVFVNLRLLIYYPAYWTQPFDYLFLHAPARLFLLITLTLLLPMSVFLAIGHEWHPPKDVTDYQWEGFAVVVTSGILGTIIAGWRRDLVWSAGTVWLLWAIGGLKPKTAPVMSTIIVFSVLIPLVFVASLVLALIHGRDEGRIRLEEGESPRPAPSPGRRTPVATNSGNHEVGSSVWG